MDGTAQGSLEFAGGSRQSVTDLLEAHRGPAPLRSPDDSEIRGGKGSVFYRAHSYHTKVPVEGLIPLIEHYTSPGDVVVDPFCGSGATGVAAMLAGRNAVVSDLSPAAVHIAQGYTTQADPSLVATAGAKILLGLADLEDRLYGDPDGRIEYTVWSDVYGCPACGVDILFWSAAVDQDAGTLTPRVGCAAGHGPFAKTEMKWRRGAPVQENLSTPHERRRLVREAGNEASGRMSRDEIPWWYPEAPWESWREMWRGQHREMGVHTAADFYTDRNLHALAALWHEINALADDEIRQALRFAFTAIVNRASKRYQWHPKRPTNVLSSTMYIAALRYEFNVFSLFRRKLRTITDLVGETWLATGRCEVREGSATSLSWIPDESVDYVFTDPPFGSNIYYGDSSFLWEAWLGRQTDVAAEAVVNKKLDATRGGTDLEGYESLMARAMAEIARILRPNAWASLQFHNTDDSVWSAIQSAVDEAGFTVAEAVVMDKGQASFKGLRHESKGERVASFDLVLHLQQRADRPARGPNVGVSRDDIEAELRRYLHKAPPRRRTTPWLHSIVMRYLLAEGAPINGWSFAAVESLCAEVFQRREDKWELPS